jgi:hypothetical protein
MRKLKLPTALSRLDIRVGTKLAITVGIGVVLVAGMIGNQQLSNASLAQQAELERNEQFVTADMLRAAVALQRMQTGTREIRLSISEREADQALAALRESMGNAVSYLQAAAQLCGDAENCARFEKLVKLAKGYVAAAAEMTALKRDYAEITKPLAEVSKIGTEIDVLIAQATSVAKAQASQRMAATAARMTDAAQINLGFGFFVVVILTGAAIFGFRSADRSNTLPAFCCSWRAGGGSSIFPIPIAATKSATRRGRRAPFATISCGSKSSRPSRSKRPRARWPSARTWCAISPTGSNRPSATSWARCHPRRPSWNRRPAP